MRDLVCQMACNAAKATEDDDEEGHQSGREALERPGLTDPESFAHEEPEVETGDVNEHPLGDVLVMSQVRASHAAGLERVREAALDQFTSQAHQTLAVVPVFPCP